jgi:prephenate dehydrogenase
VRPTTLGVIGLGAIGGSLVRQARVAGIPTILGWSPEPAQRAAAARDGLLDDAPPRVETVVERADLLVLAAPPTANRDLLARLGTRLAPAALATDVGSVKRAVMAQAEALGLASRFAGSHPMAGTHEEGFGASRSDLFRNAVVYVTPVRGGEGAGAAREIAHFWQDVLGAHPVIIDAARHDAQLAVTSHLPQVVASLLGHFLAVQTPPGATLGPGARDTTRLAAASPALWTEILLMNRDEVLPALRSLEEPLGALERALETGDARAVHAWLSRASEWRRGVAP